MSNILFEGQLPGVNKNLRILVVPDNDDEARAAGVADNVLALLGPAGTSKAALRGTDLYVRVSLWPSLKAKLEKLQVKN